MFQGHLQFHYGFRVSQQQQHKATRSFDVGKHLFLFFEHQISTNLNFKSGSDK